MKTHTSRLGLCGFLAVISGVLPMGCPPSTPTSCNALKQALVGTWIPTDEYPFAATFTLDANNVYRSGDVVGIWDLGYEPGNNFCDILFVGDSDGVIHTTYNLLLDGDRLVLSIWGSGTTYYREGTTPPPSIDCADSR